MNSKTSLFNKALFFSDIKRHWWLMLAEVLLLVVGCVIPVYNYCIYAYGSFYNYSFANWGSFSFIAVMAFALGIGAILGAFMQSNNSVSFVHALPNKRITIYVTKLVSALVLLIVPIAITSIILIVMSRTEACNNIPITEIAKWFYACLMYSLIILSLTTIVNTMTGNPIGTVVFTVGFILIPILTMNLFDEIAANELLGYMQSGQQDILESIYIGAYGLFTKRYGFTYPILSVVLLAMGYFLYRNRPLEKHGEVIAIAYLVPLFIGIVAVISSGIGYVYAKGILGIENLFTILPFGIIGTIIAHMVRKKSFDFIGSLKPCIIYLVLALCFIGAMHFDITGFEDRIPNPRKIESITFTNYDIYGECEFKDKQKIEAVTNLHTALIQKGERDKDRELYTICISYNLKNGGKLNRQYLVDLGNDSELLRPIYETKEFRECRYKLLSDDKKEIISVSISDRRVNGGEEIIFYPDNEYMQRFCDAAMTDMKNAPYESLKIDTNSSTKIGISWKSSKKDAKSYSGDVIYFDVDEHSKNTIAVLAQTGFYESVPQNEDISKIEVRLSETMSEKMISKTELTKPEDIKSLYEMYHEIIKYKKYSYSNECVDVHLNYYTVWGTSFSASATYSRDELPEVFKKLCE